MFIGAHVPTLGSYTKMMDYACSVGCECLQMFAKSPRQWSAKPLDPARAATLRHIRSERGFGPILTHTAYLINLSTNRDDQRAKSTRALADELVRATLLGADSVNTHTGNDPVGDDVAAAKRAAVAINQAIVCAADTLESLVSDGIFDGIELFQDALPLKPVRLVLENTAGAGSAFGVTARQLAQIVEASQLDNASLGICIDTCHAWAYGYDVSTQTGWDELLEGIDDELGLERLHWIHANDCKFGRGMNKDRHAWIGDGMIGLEGFRVMVNDPRLRHVNVVVEMPGEMPEKDTINIERLKALRTES